MGAPQFAVPTLERLVHLGAKVVAVYTRVPKPAGRRGLEVTKTPIQKKAESLGLPVRTPATLRSADAIDDFGSLRAEVAIVVAYGMILPRDVLSAPRYGCLNLHASLLPRWRGAAPIQRALMAGDERTGIGLMRMEEGLDTGPVAREISVSVKPDETAGEIAERLSLLAADLLELSWREIVSQTLRFRPQSTEGVTYARKIEKSEAAIDWRESAYHVRNLIRGLAPSPGAFSMVELNGQPERIKILRVESVDGQGEPGEVIGSDFRIACGVGAVRVLELQRAGRAPSSGIEAMRGGRFRVGGRFFLPSEL